MKNRARKLLKDLNLIDRFLFAEVMEDPSAYQAVLEMIFEKEIHLKDSVQSEKEFRTLPSLRGIRLDVWGEDEEDTIYNSEMQGWDTKNLPKRSRYYQSVMDAGLLEPGIVDFNALNDVWLITIIPFDLFGADRCRYTFRMRCVESESIELGDGAARIFLNTRGSNKEGLSEELQAFLKYVEHSDEETLALCDSERMKRLHECVIKVKSNEVSEVKYMQFWEEKVLERQAGIKEGGKIGEQRGKVMSLISIVRKKRQRGMNAEAIADVLEEDIKYVEFILKILQENPDADDDALFEMIKVFS